MTTKKSKPATFKAAGVSYTLHFGTAAMIALERELNLPLSELGELLKSPRISTIRDIFAAGLIQHHAQALQAEGLTTGFLKGMGLEPAPVANWGQQQRLANDLLDAVGIDQAGALIEAMMTESPLLTKVATK